MKKGITVRYDYDWLGDHSRTNIIIEKERGRLTLQEIQDALQEWECDYYLLLLDCRGEDDSQYCLVDGKNKGDRVVAYNAEYLKS